ncbi:MAG TPA: LacI family DNA-binding transcriptional regulator [Terriglobales bacterium]|nr:LacI family DNA-binding transcriptional regulator [Terriglobales bacterium]
MVTIRDVAGQSGFSITTVSMVLNQGAAAMRISEDTRAQIWKVAQRLGYRPNLFARSLRSKRSQTIGVIVFDITDAYCTQILRGIENHLRSSGYFPITTDLQNDRSQFQRCVDLLLARRVEGLIAIANPIFLDMDLLAEHAERDIPAVVIGRDLVRGPVSSIVVDNEAGARQALQHLYQLGHSRIAFIKGPKILVDTQQRWRGVENFAHDAGLKIDPNLVIQIKGRNSTYGEGCELTEELLRRRRDFTALVAFDDLTACAAIRSLTKAGRRVPKDCSVVGFDDLPGSAFYNPPLTTVQQQLEMQGSLGADIIEDLIRGKLEKRHLVAKHRKVSPKLMVRDSTCPASAGVGRGAGARTMTAAHDS